MAASKVRCAVGELHISFGRVDRWRLVRDKCPLCEMRTRKLATFQEWYGWHITCLVCGDSWQDGELMPRPFKRGWRHESVAEAEALLKRLRKQARASAHLDSNAGGER
jgi:hypothetical protein